MAGRAQAQQDHVRSEAFRGLYGLAGLRQHFNPFAASEQRDDGGVAVHDHDSKGRTHPASGGRL
ncbi:hypothetical protein GCM10027176_13870 [Actinoallomurus bryophytorum]